MTSFAIHILPHNSAGRKDDMPKSKYKKRKDGRYLAQIPTGEYDENGKAKLKNIYARTQAELDLKIGEFRLQVSSGVIFDDKNLTVKEWAEQWLKAYKSAREESTKNMYASALRKHILPYFGAAKIKNVRKHHIEEFLSMKASTPKDESGTLYSKRMLNIILLTIRQLFGQAADNHMIALNPAANVKLYEKVMRPKEEKRALTAQEKRLFLKLVETHEHGLFFKTLYYTGMRPEEARALTLKDLDFINGEISIDKAAIFVNDKPVLKGCKTTSSIRRIPLPAPLKSSLQEFAPANSTLLFPGESGGLMDKAEYTVMYDSFDADLNILAGGTEDIRALERFTPYILRHNYATMMAEAGFSPQYLMRVMGHSSADVTMKYYVHISERQMAENNARLKKWDLESKPARKNDGAKKSVKQLNQS